MVSRRTWIIHSFGIISGINLLNGDKVLANQEANVSIHELVGEKRPALFGDGFNMRKPAAEAFDAMRKAAWEEGLNLYSVSSYRSYERQKGIWNRKFRQGKQEGKTDAEIVRDIVRFSTIPGTSRHHWGTDLDIIDLKPSQPKSVLQAENFQPGGAYEKLYQWLKTNANSYGFYEVYTNEPNRTGFEYEPWHWSYLELALPYLEIFLSRDWEDYVATSDLMGQEAVREFLPRYKDEWILGVNEQMIPESLKTG